jgi:hypothetical protein
LTNNRAEKVKTNVTSQLDRRHVFVTDNEDRRPVAYFETSALRRRSQKGERAVSTTDYIVDILLIVVIFRQLRAQEYTLRNAILPIGVMVWAGFHYLHSFHVGGNDIALMSVFTVAGLALGLASGATTFMWRDDLGRVIGKVGLYACVTWIIGMGFRFAFALYASSSSGDRAIGHFSRDHAITSSLVWTTALVLMAFAEVLSRVVILQVRRIGLASAAGTVQTILLPGQRSSTDAADESARLGG